MFCTASSDSHHLPLSNSAFGVPGTDFAALGAADWIRAVAQSRFLPWRVRFDIFPASRPSHPPAPVSCVCDTRVQPDSDNVGRSAVPRSHPIVSSTLFSRSREFFLLPYSSQPRSIRADTLRDFLFRCRGAGSHPEATSSCVRFLPPARGTRLRSGFCSFLFLPPDSVLLFPNFLN